MTSEEQSGTFSEQPSGIQRRRFIGGVVASAGVAAASLAGCDSETGTRPKAASTPRQTPRHTPPTEQQLPGDPHWRVTSFGPQNAIEGYTDQVSVLPGQDVTLHVSTTAKTFHVSAYRVGWYQGTQARLVWRSDSYDGSAQGTPTFRDATRTIAADWDSTVTLHTDGWPAGAYLLRLDADSGHQRYVPFVLRSASAAGKTLIMHAPATWQAYNVWGGYSLYQGENGAYDTRSLVVSFNRPYDTNGAEKFLVYERAAVVLAERLGIPLAYTTGMDIANDPSILKGAASVFSLGHDEYWTPQQRKYVTAARDQGTNLAFLGANTCFRRVRLDAPGHDANRVVVCYKTAYEDDPYYGRDDALVTTDFRAQPAADPESTMTGVLYEGYPTDAPYVIHAADHWVYEGTGVKNGDSFEHLVGVEYDRVTPGPYLPRPVEILAHSPLVCNGSHSHSDSAYYTVPSGAGVFASGTMRWVEGLMVGTGDDGDDHDIPAKTQPFVTRTTENVFRAFAEGPAGRSMPAPRDNVDTVYA